MTQLTTLLCWFSALLLVPAWVSAAPAVVVRFTDNGNALRVEAPMSDDTIRECLNDGLEVVYRYEMKFCARDQWWFDRCSKTRIEIRSARLDAVSETFSIIDDVHGDTSAPAEYSAQTAEETLQALELIKKVPLKDFENGEQIGRAGRLYVSVHVRASCKEDEKSLASQIPYYLTFGQLRLGAVEFGWTDFFFDRAQWSAAK